jgi:hypothetical protein
MHGLIVIAILDLLILLAGVVGAVGIPRLFYGLTPEEADHFAKLPGLFGGGHLAFLSLAMGAIAIVTFLGSLRIGISTAGGTPSEAWMQRAIVIAVVTVYLVLVSVVAFFRVGGELPPVVSTLLGSFTATVSVIVAFYFGSSAYVEAARAKAQIQQ